MGTLKLEKYYDQACQWCIDNEAASLQEIREESEDFAEFLGMGQSTIARFEANLAKPSGSSVSVLRLCQLPGALKILVIHAKREGRFSDIVEQKRDFIFVAGE